MIRPFAPADLEPAIALWKRACALTHAFLPAEFLDTVEGQFRAGGMNASSTVVFDEGGVRYHHIIDPKTGRSPHAVRSVTIIASNATRTDGLSKTVFILGPKDGIEFINSLPDADAIVIAADGKVSYSKGMQPP